MHGRIMTNPLSKSIFLNGKKKELHPQKALQEKSKEHPDRTDKVPSLLIPILAFSPPNLSLFVLFSVHLSLQQCNSPKKKEERRL